MKSPARFLLASALACWCALNASAATNFVTLAYAPAPANNPLKGFFPYAGSYATFPHSLEWDYLPLRSLMTGPTNFNWAPLDAKLDDIASRGHQTVFRIYLDLPSLPTGIPQYLLDAGLVTHSYTDYDNNNVSLSPDYENPLLRQALTNFIAALGARYDGDARIGFITVGLLGFWGEWHTYPHDTWFASVTVQDEVLSAYEAAFTRTKFLLRQPFGTSPGARRMGYHDDSFAFETIDPPTWHFLGALKAAGETNKWRTQPIGGEVRPEVQACMWDAVSCVPAGQAYTNCVDQTHASWMLNHGAFEPGFTGAKLTNALAGARRLGYELYVTNAELVDARISGPLTARVTLRNRGVAPFYYDWPVQLSVLNSNNQPVATWTTTWKLTSLLPATTNTTWSHTQTNHGLAAGSYKLLVHALNPLTNGVPFRFANQAQDTNVVGWLTLGTFSVLPDLQRPTLRGDRGTNGFSLHVSGTVPGAWDIETTASFSSWTALLTTNIAVSEWDYLDLQPLPWRFYRVVGRP